MVGDSKPCSPHREMAEGQGFEPWRDLRPCRFSRPVLSTTQPALPQPRTLTQGRLRGQPGQLPAFSPAALKGYPHTMSQTEPYRVLLADDHQLVRVGIGRLLEETGRVVVVGEVESGEEALSEVRSLRPDVVFMDVNMPGMGGLEATRRLKASSGDVAVIALSIYTDGPLPGLMLEAGASGYLTKGTNTEEMLLALDTVSRGERYLCHEVASHIALSRLAWGSDNPFDALSAREVQIVLLMLRGLRGVDMAKVLNVSPKTISTHRHRIFDKLSIRSDGELIRLAMEYGLDPTHATDADG